MKTKTNRVRIKIDVTIEYDQEMNTLPRLPSCPLLHDGLSNVFDVLNKAKGNKGPKATGIAPGMRYQFQLDSRK